MGAKTLPENKKSTGQKFFDFWPKIKNFSAKNGSTFWLYFFAFSPEGFSKPSSRLQRLPLEDFPNRQRSSGSTTSLIPRYLAQNLVRRIYLHYLCSSNTESITTFDGLLPAEIAQLVEHNLAKVRVASSSLVFRSKQKFSYSCLVRPLKRAYLLEGVLYSDLSKKRKRKHCTTHLILLPLHEIVE